MSFDLLPYLTSLQNNIRGRSIAWEGAVRAGTISEEQLNKIKAVDKVRKEQQKQIVKNDLGGYSCLFLGAEGKPGILDAAVKRADLVQNILVLLADLLAGIPELSKTLSQHSSPYNIFVTLITRSNDAEDPVSLLSSTVLTALIMDTSVDHPKKKPALSELFKYLSSLTRASDGSLQDIAVVQYSTLLREKKSRELFWVQRKETIAPLITILQLAAGFSKDALRSPTWNGTKSIRSNNEGTIGGGVGLQMLYHILLVLWQLSFEGSNVGEGLQDEFDIIPLYVQLLRYSPKEKITRLLLSSLHNMLIGNRQKLLPLTVVVRLPALLQNINGRHLSDPDLSEDLEALTRMIDDYTKTQTTFDEYAAEIYSGHLYWSPPHRNSTFWLENAHKILDHEKGAIPKKLAEIMSKPWVGDKQVLAIACNDVGSLVKQVPEKRLYLEKLGLKKRIMELMQESDESVRWESLNALSGWLRYSFES
ncbi:V-type proton ATPase subunit H [Golovinomyces cichoracearum]|uniref:V-type proton ATPase subunit H n=1 Tax=Golovinomyces cichoracearum TaxID=62708 RepID=A0A420I966_9PEZI|nr:V-type proton ATPase subunit H [Golovinomyces cichoracearum]